jgi:hypothetical protein
MTVNIRPTNVTVHDQYQNKSSLVIKFRIKLVLMILLVSRVEHKEEEVTDLIIPLNKCNHNKPEVQQKEDVQRKKIGTEDISTHTVGGDSISSNSLEETAVREILEGWFLVYYFYLFIISYILSNYYS